MMLGSYLLVILFLLGVFFSLFLLAHFLAVSRDFFFRGANFLNYMLGVTKTLIVVHSLHGEWQVSLHDITVFTKRTSAHSCPYEIFYSVSCVFIFHTYVNIITHCNINLYHDHEYVSRYYIHTFEIHSFFI